MLEVAFVCWEGCAPARLSWKCLGGRLGVEAAQRQWQPDEAAQWRPLEQPATGKAHD